MKQIGNRIYYNQNGKVIFQTGERSDGVIEQVENEIISYIDLPYGDKTLENVIAFHVVNGQIVIDERIETSLTSEQERIIELENQLLIAEGVI